MDNQHLIDYYHLWLGLGGEVGLDIEVCEKDEEDESVGEHIVRELQGEGTIVVEDLKNSLKLKKIIHRQRDKDNFFLM